MKNILVYCITFFNFHQEKKAARKRTAFEFLFRAFAPARNKHHRKPDYKPKHRRANPS